MKKIVLDGIREPLIRSVRSIDKNYIFNMGNGSFYAFKSRVQIEKFQNEAERALNDVLIQLNDILITTRTLYQQNWIYFDNNSDLEKTIIMNLQMIEQAMFYLVNKSTGANHNSWIFQKFNIITDSFKVMSEQLSELLYSRVNYYDAKRMIIQKRTWRR